VIVAKMYKVFLLFLRLVNSSDDDPNSSLSGYNGDCDSEGNIDFGFSVGFRDSGWMEFKVKGQIRVC
jgi:hypothetical protein